MTPEEIFLAYRPHIDKVVTHLCRRHHLRKEECEDFRSRVYTKILDNDYAVIRKFQERSSLKTYLTTVVVNEMKDYQNHLWGKWRPSAKAERLGPTAILLERLLVRDEYSFDEAVQILQINHKLDMSWQKLEELAGQLPSRWSRQTEGEDGLCDIPAPTGRADDGVAAEERRKRRREAIKALKEARKSLPEEDQLILKMMVKDRFTVAQISRLLRHDQKQLYRRIQKILKELREELERQGFHQTDIDDLFEDDLLEDEDDPDED